MYDVFTPELAFLQFDFQWFRDAMIFPGRGYESEG